MNEVKARRSVINTHQNTNRLHTHITKGPVRYDPPSPPGWRNEPHALSHPFPSCSALACSSVEPPCCRSESLGCQRETGAEIRDHPPSPPVSIMYFAVAVSRDVVYPSIGAGIVATAALRGFKRDYFVRLKLLPPFLLPASFLPLCRSSAPDSSRAFVSIRVTGSCGAACSADRQGPPGVY